MYTFAPEFNKIGPDAIDRCVEFGAAKISEVISFDSLNNFLDSPTEDPDQVRDRLPELEPLWEYLWCGSLTKYAGTQVVLLKPEGMSKAKVVDVHQDLIAPSGITALVPYIGDRALFAADEEEFVFKPDLVQPFDSTRLPSFITEYGPGDVILFREALKRVNGRDVDLSAMWHAGLSHKQRRLVSVDFLGDSLDY